MKVPDEVCRADNANMTLSNSTVHSLINLQSSFRAGGLQHFLPNWKSITTDLNILQFV